MKCKQFYIMGILCSLMAVAVYGSVVEVPEAPARMTAVVVGGGGGGAAPTTSYSNTGGSGDRTSVITVTGGAGINFADGLETKIIDGTNNSGTGYWQANECNGSDTWVLFDFGAAHTVLIDEAKFYQSGTDSHGTHQWAGSNDGVAFTNIGSTFTWGGVATQTQTELSANTTEYRYYRAMCTTGTHSSGPYIYELEFKIYGY